MPYVYALVGILLLIIIVLIAILFYISRKTGNSDQNNNLENRLKDINTTLDSRLNQNTESMTNQMRSQFESSKKLIEDVTRGITEVKETGREMLSFTGNLQSLEQTLKNPQRRGALGEYMLEQVISNVLPPDNYSTQHTFKNDVRADIVIYLQDKKLVSVDAKFSLENYTKLLDDENKEDKDVLEKRLKEDIKKRIQETAKYILPKENTLDFAFMFIPSEALYYDLLTQKIGSGAGEQNMLEYAFRQHKVIIVSPTTLLAYLQTVNLGLRSLKVEENAQEIMKNVEMLNKHLEKYSETFEGLGKSLGAVINKYNESSKQYSLLDKDVLKISGKGGKFKKNLIDSPDMLDQ